MIHLINDVEIISKVTEEKHNVQLGEIKFNLLRELVLLKKQLDDTNKEFIDINLKNKKLTILCRTIDKINYNKLPYVFNFYTLLNNKFVGYCILDDMYIEHHTNISYERITKLNIRTGSGTKLMVKKLPI